MSVLEEYLELVRAATAEIESLRQQLAESKVILQEAQALRSRLAEAERDAARYRFLRDRDGMGNIFMHTPTCELDAAIDREIATDSADDVINAQHDETGRVWRGPRSQLPHRYFEVDEICCLDYPRCDCNSPPEPDDAPALQPCGHPWKAQHDFKCILCSSPGDAAYAQSVEEQRFPHGAPAVQEVMCEACKGEGAYAGTDRICLTCSGLGTLRYNGSAPAEWPTREEAEKRAAELMAIGRATLAAADSAPDVTCATHGCTYRDGKCIRCWGRDAHSKAIDSLLDDCATVYGGPFPEGTK